MSLEAGRTLQQFVNGVCPAYPLCACFYAGWSFAMWSQNTLPELLWEVWSDFESDRVLLYLGNLESWKIPQPLKPYRSRGFEVLVS